MNWDSLLVGVAGWTGMHWEEREDGWLVAHTTIVPTIGKGGWVPPLNLETPIRQHLRHTMALVDKLMVTAFGFGAEDSISRTSGSWKAISTHLPWWT